MAKTEPKTTLTLITQQTETTQQHHKNHIEDTSSLYLKVKTYTTNIVTGSSDPKITKQQLNKLQLQEKTPPQQQEPTKKHPQRKQTPRPPPALCTLCNSDRPNRHLKEHCRAIKCSNTWCGKFFHYATQCRKQPPKNNNQPQVNAMTPHQQQQQQ